MIRRIVLAGAVVGLTLLLASCSKKNDDKAPAEENYDYPSQRLVSIHYSDESNGFDSLLYQNGKLVNFGKGYSRATPGSAPYISESYAYGAQGKAVKASLNYSADYIVPDTIIYKDNLMLICEIGNTDTTYITTNSNGQMLKAIYTGEISGTALFNYDGRNLSSYSFDGTIQGATYKVATTFTYDDHPNPAYGICRYNPHCYSVWKNQYLFPFGAIMQTHLFTSVDSYNNPLTIKITETADGRTTLSNLVNCSYAYDSISNFPLSQAVNFQQTINGYIYGGSQIYTLSYQ